MVRAPSSASRSSAGLLAEPELAGPDVGRPPPSRTADGLDANTEFRQPPPCAPSEPPPRRAPLTGLLRRAFAYLIRVGKLGSGAAVQLGAFIGICQWRGQAGRQQQPAAGPQGAQMGVHTGLAGVRKHADASKSTLQDRAQTTLSALRVADPKLRIADYLDAGAAGAEALEARLVALRAYYPVLNDATPLARDAWLRPAVEALVEGMGIPYDLHLLLRCAAGLDGVEAASSMLKMPPVAAETGQPVPARLARSVAALPLDLAESPGWGPVPKGLTRGEIIEDDRPEAWSDSRIRNAWLGDALVHGLVCTPDALAHLAPRTAILICARAVELATDHRNPAPNAQVVSDALRAWLKRGVAEDFASAPELPALLRLSRVLEVDAAQVFLNGKGAPQTLATAVALQQSVILNRCMAAFCKNTTSLRRLIGLERACAFGNGIEIAHLLSAALAPAPKGRGTIDWRMLKSDQQARLAALLTADAHVGVTVVLSAVFVSDMDWAHLERSLSSRRITAEDIEAHAQLHARLVALKPGDLNFVLEDVIAAQPDYTTLDARISLKEMGPADIKMLPALRKRFPALTAPQVARLALSLLGARSMQLQGLLQALTPLLVQGVLEAKSLGQAARSYGLSGQDIFAIVRDNYLQRQVMQPQLLAFATACLGDGWEPLAAVLKERYRRDLGSALPLGDAKLSADGTKTCQLAGIPILVYPSPSETRAAGTDLPTLADAALEMTPVTQANARKVAEAWRRGAAVMLSGPLAAGKTSLVRYFAAVLQLPFRRVNFSPETETDDLIGRYVPGLRVPSAETLEAMPLAALQGLATQGGVDPNQARDVLLQALQTMPAGLRWVDGPLLTAMRRGEVLLLDEANLAPEVIERLNGLFDDEKHVVVQEHGHEIVRPHPNFRILAAINPVGHTGRHTFSAAVRSRWVTLNVDALPSADLQMIVDKRFGSIPLQQRRKLLEMHADFASASRAGTISDSSGGDVYSLRTLMRVCERYEEFAGPHADAAALMRREAWEVYAGGLAPGASREKAEALLGTHMPAAPYDYGELEVKPVAGGIQLGDIVLRPRQPDAAGVPSTAAVLTWTPQIKEIIYRMAKAREGVVLVGACGSGKTAAVRFYAHLMGLPYYAQVLRPDTQLSEVVGGITLQGWQDGPLLRAGRPEGIGGVMLLDELNLPTSMATMEGLNSVLDGGRSVTLNEHGGQHVRLHEDFHCFGTMNPPGPAYPGRQRIPQTLKSRLTFIYVDEPDSAAYRPIAKALAVKLRLPAEVSERVTDLHHRLTETKDSGSFRPADKTADVSLRTLLHTLNTIADLRFSFSTHKAYLEAVALNYGDSRRITREALTVWPQP